MLEKLRKETEFTQSQLCKGIYSLSAYARVEAEQTEPGYFELDRLFERLGKSTDRLEYVMSLDVYELYELQYFVQRAICHRDFEKAEKVLAEYERKKQAEQPIHRQYICQMWAQILWLKSQEKDAVEEVLKWIEEAIVQTMDPENCLTDGSALSAEELKLLLFRWEVSQKSAGARKEKELEEVFCYLNRHTFEEEELAKVYPYAVLLLVEKKKTAENYDKCCYWLKTALEVLCNTGRVLYMTEILDTYAEFLKRGREDIQKTKELESQSRSLLALEKEADIHLENYRLFHNWNRYFELDYELIRHERTARKISQAELANGICEPETLSRIEGGKRRPNTRKLEAMLEKMHRERKRISMMVVAEQYSVLELEKQITAYDQQQDYEKANELLRKLEAQLDMSQKRNQQYVGVENLMYLVHLQKINEDEYILQLNHLLALTLEDQKNIFEHNLTETENIILNLLACSYEKKGEVDKAFEIWKVLLEKCESRKVHSIFNFRIWELMNGNYSGAMEEHGFSKEPFHKCLIWAEKALSIGMGKRIGRILSIEACILEKQHNKKCIERFRQALDILKLMKNTYRYNCNREYLKEKGLLEIVEFS